VRLIYLHIVPYLHSVDSPSSIWSSWSSSVTLFSPLLWSREGMVENNIECFELMWAWKCNPITDLFLKIGNNFGFLRMWNFGFGIFFYFLPSLIRVMKTLWKVKCGNVQGLFSHARRQGTWDVLYPRSLETWKKLHFLFWVVYGAERLKIQFQLETLCLLC